MDSLEETDHMRRLIIDFLWPKKQNKHISAQSDVTVHSVVLHSNFALRSQHVDRIKLIFYLFFSSTT